MATDATGTPTNPDNIPTYNTAVDAPSGKGLNNIVAALQTALSGRLSKSIWTTTGDMLYATAASTPVRLGIGSASQVLGVSGGVPVWGGVAPSVITGYPSDGTKFLKGDGTWATAAAGVSVVDYVEFNSNKSGSVDVVVGAGFTADGSSNYLIEFFAPGYQGPNAGSGTVSVNLKEGATDLGIVYQAGFSVWGSGNIQSQYGVYGARRIVPSAAAHTYKFSMSGAGTILAGAGGAATLMPGYIKITKGL